MLSVLLLNHRVYESIDFSFPEDSTFSMGLSCLFVTDTIQNCGYYFNLVISFCWKQGLEKLNDILFSKTEKIIHTTTFHGD